MVNGGSSWTTWLLPVVGDGAPRVSMGSVSSSVGTLHLGTGSCQGQAAVGVKALKAAEGLKCGATSGSWSHSTNFFQ